MGIGLALGFGFIKISIGIGMDITVGKNFVLFIIKLQFKYNQAIYTLNKKINLCLSRFFIIFSFVALLLLFSKSISCSGYSEYLSSFACFYSNKTIKKIKTSKKIKDKPVEDKPAEDN